MLAYFICPEKVELDANGVANPRDDSSFFERLINPMQFCAAQLPGVTLKTIQPDFEAKGTADAIIESARELTRQPPKPDLVIFVNKNATAVECFEIFEEAEISSFLIIEALQATQEMKAGSPGGKFKKWIGQFLPDDRQAGVLLAEQVFKTAVSDETRYAPDGKIHVGVIPGGATAAGVHRYTGFRAVAAKDPDRVVLHPTPNADFEKEKARVRAAALLEEKPEISVMLCANDLMALGAIEAIEAAGKRPGKDIILGGIDWAPGITDLIQRGVISCDIGGHYMDGAWGLIKAFDRLNGKMPEEEVETSEWAALTLGNIEEFLPHFDQEWLQKIPYGEFSLVENPGQENYDFSPQRISQLMAERS